ncbi:MAG: hypothetical protein HUJ73_00355, partial [Eubacterium sp.]|nr:hypothetical protein [Eubacterium sp.]
TSTEMHDRRLQRCAVCFGRLVYDNRIAAHHIRHDAAVTAGDSDNASLLKNWVKNELGGDALAREKAGLREFYEQYKDRLSEKDRKILSLFVSEDNSLPARMKKVFYPHRLMTRAGGEAALRLSFLLGKR